MSEAVKKTPFKPAGFLEKLFRSRTLIWMLALREFKAAYAGSSLGLLWAVLNPMTQVAVYGIVFGVFFKSVPDPVYRTDSFLLFLLCGIIPWQFFASTLHLSTSVLINNRSLIKKAVGFPPEALPVSTLAVGLLSHMIGLLILASALIIFNKGFTPYALALFPNMLFLLMIGLGLGFIISSVNVFLRDANQVMGLLTTVWLFATPVFYSPGIIPERYLFIIKLNPMFHVVEGYRLSLLAGTAQAPFDLWYLAVSSLAILTAGILLFRRLKPWFPEVL